VWWRVVQKGETGGSEYEFTRDECTLRIILSVGEYNILVHACVRFYIHTLIFSNRYRARWRTPWRLESLFAIRAADSSRLQDPVAPLRSAIQAHGYLLVSMAWSRSWLVKIAVQVT
jgi:hypothetical protein